MASTFYFSLLPAILFILHMHISIFSLDHFFLQRSDGRTQIHNNHVMAKVSHLYASNNLIFIEFEESTERDRQDYLNAMKKVVKPDMQWIRIFQDVHQL